MTIVDATFLMIVALSIIWFRISYLQQRFLAEQEKIFERIEKLVAYEIADCFSTVDQFRIGADENSDVSQRGQICQFTIVNGCDGEKFLLRNFKGKLSNLDATKIKGLSKYGHFSAKTKKISNNKRNAAKDKTKGDGNQI